MPPCEKHNKGTYTYRGAIKYIENQYIYAEKPL